MGLIPIFCSILTLTAREIRNVLLSKKNAVIIHTDTVIGILSISKETIERIKGRSPGEKKIVKLIGTGGSIGTSIIPPDLKRIMDRWWPGPLTIIYGGDSYRMPGDKFLLEILEDIDFVYASSANITKKSPVKTIEEARRTFTGENIYFVEDTEGRGERTNVPSTIFDYDEGRVIREGSIGEEEILSLVRRS